MASQDMNVRCRLLFFYKEKKKLCHGWDLLTAMKVVLFQKSTVYGGITDDAVA